MEPRSSLMLRFNSRTPCGVRQHITVITSQRTQFQFTHPVWGATSMMTLVVYSSMEFQFTHPVWGATKPHTRRVRLGYCFNSRTPCGVRLSDLNVMVARGTFQFTHPVWGATQLQTYH